MTLAYNPKVYIIGNNKGSQAIGSSVKNGDYVIVDEIRAKYELTDIFDRLTQDQDSKITIIINNGSDDKNIELANVYCDAVNAQTAEVKEGLFGRLAVYFFCEVYRKEIDDIVQNSNGCIHRKSKGQMIALNFIERYPFAYFMTDSHIDYSSALVKEGVNINVCMVGFGETSRQIFLTSVANNQFLTEDDSQPDGVALKQVEYHIFDRDIKDSASQLNDSYYRYKCEVLENTSTVSSDYLPLPQLPANEHYHNIDINMYEAIRQIADNKRDINFAIIASDDDIQNIQMARTLLQMRKEWGVDNLIIFVRVNGKSDFALPRAIQQDVIVFGDESQEVYSIEEIAGDIIFRMAKMRNAIYDLEYEVTHNKDFVLESAVDECKNASNKRWHIKRSQLERDSSIYCCLSLKSKLNLMGLDYCKVDEMQDSMAMSEDEYLKYYAQDDMPDFNSYSVQIDGKSIAKFTLDFPPSKRKNLAILEHYRWNSYMISKGIIPSTRQQILTEKSNGKNYASRRHGNLTTFEGLIEFRQMVAQKNNSSELEEDVIKYDYQILDDAYWLLNKNGYKIIKKNA